jgi:uncharacterized protein YjiS (DUF1127 family)
MRTSIDSDTLAAFEEVARYDVSTCSDTPIVILRRGSAGNDATCEDHPAISASATFNLGKIIVAAIQAVGAIARRAHARRRRRQEAKNIYDTLHQLDDRTLRDLGLDRSEIPSLAAEVTGGAEPTRVRALLMSHTFP